jgi:hypothetical protein
MRRVRLSNVLAGMLLAVLAAMPAAGAQTNNAVPPRIPLHQRPYVNSHPEAWREFLSRLPRPPALRSPMTTPALTPNGGSWQTTTNSFPDAAGGSAPLLLTDGTVIVHAPNTGRWYRLTPDNTGSYVGGTWTQIASLPNGYTPLYFASAVLPDGRVIVNGGEYNGNGTQVEANLGAIYDPVLNTWVSVSAPSGWTTIGDAQSIVLSNGTYMLADCCSRNEALFDATNLTFTATGTGKFDVNDEEGWSLLPDGTVLSVDAYVGAPTCGMNSERYTPSTRSWASAGNTPFQLADCGSPNFSYELGPQVLRPDGTLIAFGGTTSGVAHTAIFQTATSTWSPGPNLPIISGQNYTLADAPAALLPSGNILFAASPGLFSSPVHFFEFDGTNITQVADTPDASTLPSYVLNFLLLPTGQVLATDFSRNIEIYTPSGSPNPAWLPAITSVPAILGPGSTVQLSGLQLNGLSQGAAYGDDNQSSTNYPLVRITNTASGHVFYPRTFGSSTHSIAPTTPSTTNFIVPATIETGASSLVVIANGIASAPVSVAIGSVFALSASVSGSGTVTSSPSGINCGATCSASFGVGTQVSLTATPATGWRFAGWGGACSGTGACTVTMNANTSVSATFSPITFSLAVSKIGSSNGTVTSSPSGITHQSAS